MKKFLIPAGLLILALLAGLFWLNNNVDRLIRDAIERYGSEMTQATVRVGSVEIRSGEGRAILRNVTLGNPAGFKTAHLLQVAQIDVDIDLGSLTTDVVRIQRIHIQAPDVIYEKGESQTNIEAIQQNIARYLGPGTGSSSPPGKKLIVDELTLRDARAQASAAFMQGKTVAVPLPDITLRNLGKAKGGIPPGELGQEIAQALKQRLSQAVSFDNLAKSAGQALDRAGQAIKGLFQ